MTSQPVAALFVRADSVYKQMIGVDAWDAERDAWAWPGGCPVVAHPPCRAWGRLRHMANPRPGERELALWAVDQIREYGGVLEHPASSLLWKEKPLPEPGQTDAWGGWTLVVSQWWWGHKAEKATRLYICGATPAELPPIPYRIGESSHVIAQSNRWQKLRLRPEVTKAEREHTPPAFAEWLVQVAKLCAKQNERAAA
ncbi:hypothetical protein [Chromobacterium haemolyticum]|uniref:hypothetical protein n=1 Tax=Chromobacterium haemolyticum TaxID=394935 RepID=UPI001C392CCD|nr:hypothetical protein [Chromobacterium haemolyticum]